MYLIIGRESRRIDLKSSSCKISEDINALKKDWFLKSDGDAFVGEVAFGFGDGDFLEVKNRSGEHGIGFPFYNTLVHMFQRSCAA